MLVLRVLHLGLQVALETLFSHRTEAGIVESVLSTFSSILRLQVDIGTVVVGVGSVVVVVAVGTVVAWGRIIVQTVAV